jgi:hypothetical protein
MVAAEIHQQYMDQDIQPQAAYSYLEFAVACEDVPRKGLVYKLDKVELPEIQGDTSNCQLDL